ncbi:cell division protein FtsZ [Helicobacter monodelphidis]|uniref:cell division protein FtsZ n=1 Tax=Helicobacter sp. 15-1451 TaxID=2004995 RepID=UPI000DCBD412|nr:cell division protein FtsZ [Helicobacter sp. 15-1451]RAX58661.1 cell division protein FtsZ [Helicobacter sp. 15-1451]
MMDIQIMETQPPIEGAKIKVIGVGGGGGNMISYLMQMDIDESIELIVANTDAQALHKSPAPTKMQLGLNETKGLGAGMKPEKGRKAAEESYEDIKAVLEGADIVFISAGLGGGTGTGAAPIIARAAKEVGALVIAVVTKPFKFEAGKRDRLAKEGFVELKKETDTIVVIPNDKLLSIIDKSAGLKETFKIVDSVLAKAVDGMSRVILQTGSNDINVDFADVCTVMSWQGAALMGMGESTGSNAAYEAIKSAIESPLFDNISINGARGLLVNFRLHPDYPFQEISAAMESICNSLDTDADVFFGTHSDDTLPEDKIEVTIIATGFEKEQEQQSIAVTSPTPISNNTQQLSSQPVSGGEQTAASLSASPMQHMQLRRVSGSDYFQTNPDDLDQPSFFRKQMD